MMDRPLLVSGVLRHAERIHGDQEIVGCRNGESATTTFAELARRARLLGAALAASGIRPGQRIGTLAWNTIDHIEILFAATGIGAVFHPINPRLGVTEIRHVIRHADDTVVLFDPELADLVDDLRPALASDRWLAIGTPEARLVSCPAYGEPLAPGDRDFDWPDNLTPVAEDKGNLLLPWVMEMARQVEEQLYTQSSGRERLLLQHFLTTSRGSARPVVVVSPEMMLANPAATRLLENVPQALLWEFAAKAVADSATTVDELLGDDHRVAVRCFPINEAGRIIGATLEFDRARPAARRSVGPARGLPGLVGRSVAWRQVCRQVVALWGLGRTPGVVIAGEPGVGKRSVALALLAGHRAAATPALFDGALEATQRPEWLERLRAQLIGGSGAPVVIAHLDCLEDATMRAVCAVFDEAGTDAPEIVATLTVGERPVTHCAPLLDRIGQIRVDVPPLRQRPEDILDLVPALLERLSTEPAGRRASSEAVQALTRFAWPGNVRQLESTLWAALARSGRAELRPDDLPAEVRRGAAGRRLTPMEQAELDAILAALEETDGNKVTTAARLGISRSTLYRKMRSFGLELDQVVF